MVAFVDHTQHYVKGVLPCRPIFCAVFTVSFSQQSSFVVATTMAADQESSMTYGL